MKKIIIMYSTSGLGHKYTGEGILQALQKREKEIDVKFINILDYGNGFFKFLHFKFYVTLMKYAKKLWAFLYYLSDMPVTSTIIRKTLHALDSKSWRGLEELMIKEKPDAIIATHFFLTSIAHSIKSNPALKVKLYLMVSGFGMHNVWFSKDIDHFFVGSDDVQKDLMKRGIHYEDITVTGMPTKDAFKAQGDVVKLRAEFGLDAEKKTVLLLSGGYGVAPIESILGSLRLVKAPIQVIAICGYNEDAYANVNKNKDKYGFPVKAFGFTDKVPELMSVSDLIITKAGTSSITQAMAMCLPMILFSYVPGHETPTVEYLLESGVALEARNMGEIPALVDDILLDKDLYDKMKKGLEKIRKPNAADEIVDIVLEDLDLV
ncbi:MAG TPA: glycosyltransferase [Candidatus Omnitrophota bacterium]|nr:glycosyltransferase [Candidatus Omnitrophota bacterium]HPS19568.1 glycosyltransferase [Candidatus Omnitrophota bacterium]